MKRSRAVDNDQSGTTSYRHVRSLDIALPLLCFGVLF